MLCLPWVLWTVCTVRYSKKINWWQNQQCRTISFPMPPIDNRKGDTFLDQCLMICSRQCNLRKPGVVLIFCPWNPWRCRVTWQTFVWPCSRFFQSAQLWSKFSQSFGFSPYLLPSNQPTNLREIIHLQIRQQEKVDRLPLLSGIKCYRKRASRLWNWTQIHFSFVTWV